jgi:hypothetical protein
VVPDEGQASSSSSRSRIRAQSLTAADGAGGISDGLREHSAGVLEDPTAARRQVRPQGRVLGQALSVTERSVDALRGRCRGPCCYAKRWRPAASTARGAGLSTRGRAPATGGAAAIRRQRAGESRGVGQSNRIRRRPASRRVIHDRPIRSPHFDQEPGNARFVDPVGSGKGKCIVADVSWRR